MMLHSSPYGDLAHDDAPACFHLRAGYTSAGERVCVECGAPRPMPLEDAIVLRTWRRSTRRPATTTTTLRKAS